MPDTWADVAALPDVVVGLVLSLLLHAATAAMQTATVRMRLETIP
jgi:hypothetical protein